MKSHTTFGIQAVKMAVIVFAFFCSPATSYGDIVFEGGVSAQIDYTVDGHVWIYDANVVMIDPAHIQGAVVTGSGAVLDVYGGKIDLLLMISKSDTQLPEGIVTVYATDFFVNGDPVAPETTELFLMGEELSGTYANGQSFAFPVECILEGGRYIYYQTVKLGWVVSQPDIEVEELNTNFGQLDIGSTKAKVITVYNQGGAALSVESLELSQGQLTQFSMAPLDELPAVVEPNSIIDLEVNFSPAAEGIETAVLSILSNDPNDPVVDVVLTGEGILAEVSPEKQIDQIQDDYTQAVEEGAIYGVGKGNSATNKVNTFGKMLAVAEELLLAGYDEYALETLLMIEKKCDGEKSPKDFIKGAAAEELNTMINELIESLQ